MHIEYTGESRASRAFYWSYDVATLCDTIGFQLGNRRRGRGRRPSPVAHHHHCVAFVVLSLVSSSAHSWGVFRVVLVSSVAKGAVFTFFFVLVHIRSSRTRTSSRTSVYIEGVWFLVVLKCRCFFFWGGERGSLNIKAALIVINYELSTANSANFRQAYWLSISH